MAAFFDFISIMSYRIDRTNVYLSKNLYDIYNKTIKKVGKVIHFSYLYVKVCYKLIV